MDKLKTVCFTGHRAQKLPWRFCEEDERCLTMKKTLWEVTEKAIQRGYDTFLCGMALGFDMICAETVIALRRKYPDIKIIGAIPCKNQDAVWSEYDRSRYRNAVRKLDGIRCIYRKYVGAKCMLERNQYMVDNSSLMIALYNGMAGGTRATIEYARKRGLEIIIIAP